MLSDDFEDFLKLLNHYDVEYLVVGGYAMAFHGKPRYTGDLDVWINISETNALRMVSVINDFGFASVGFTAEDFSRPNLINQIGYPPLRIDILTSIDGVEFDEAYEVKLKIELDAGVDVNYIGLDELIKNKKSSGRKIDISDVSDLESEL
ncbi:hypothetical protein H7U22_05590 [Pedobacter sp. CCM 8938]|uniref:Nucleotidyl transferase AbiEii toxin, Type IV TA system n=1 Tax=Pedobacter fastidiosus TaxID=2765361 RepID=A0ABR7KP75_9SPHI|nr:hypothetical protein [Pedobacter fastidiosus]